MHWIVSDFLYFHNQLAANQQEIPPESNNSSLDRRNSYAAVAEIINKPTETDPVHTLIFHGIVEDWMEQVYNKI